MTNPINPRLSIVIPTYNAAATLGEQLRALAGSIRDDMEVIVVDNRSTDASRSIATEFARSDQRFRVVDAVDRQGEPHARNVGVQAAASNAIAFCDADDVVAPTWAVAMGDALQGADFVTGPVDVDALNPSWLAGVRGQRIFTQVARTPAGTPFAHGCNFGVSRAAADAVGGFDESWLIGCDIEFAIRLRRQGCELAWAPEALVHYRLRATWRERWKQAHSYGRATRRVRSLEHQGGRPPRPLSLQMRRIAWLIVRLPRLGSRSTRAKWWWTLALVTGELGRGR